MINERRAILVLIDRRRIPVAEAERLIAAWEDAREWFWIAVACAAFCLFESHPHITLEGLASLLHAFVDHGTKLLYNTASFGLKKVGGIV